MSEQRNTRRLAIKISLYQVLLLAISGVALLLSASAVALAALAGAAIGLAGSSAFALFSLRSKDSRSAGRVVFETYLGKVAEWSIVVAGLLWVYTKLPGIDQGINVLTMLGVLLLSQCAYIIAPMFPGRR